MEVKIKSSPVRGEKTLPPSMGGIKGGVVYFYALL